MWDARFHPLTYIMSAILWSLPSLCSVIVIVARRATADSNKVLGCIAGHMFEHNIHLGWGACVVSVCPSQCALGTGSKLPDCCVEQPRPQKAWRL